MLDLSPEALNRRIEALRTGFAGYVTTTSARNQALLRGFSPPFDSRLGEFDQWLDPILTKDEGHTRSSYNMTRAVVEMWAALEAEELPAIRWGEGYIPTPVPSMDPAENSRRQQIHRSSKLVARQVSTMREQTLDRHVQRAKLPYHFYRATLRKNIYGASWMKLYPEIGRRRFCAVSRLDPSTIYPVWSWADDSKLDAILVAYRRSVTSVNAEYPGFLPMDRNGISVVTDGYYNPTNRPVSDADRNFVWVEDYWALDATYEQFDADSGIPIRSIVVNGLRVNGKFLSRVEYPGWRRVPYFLHENENERDRFGFSDAGSMSPIQDGFNRFLSQQQDVIFGESRPRYKFRGDADRQIILEDEQVVSLDPDEDIEQITTNVNVFPTQVHGTQLLEVMSRVTGLNDTVWGKIGQNANSGRALSTAWRSVAARLVPRVMRNTVTYSEELEFMLDLMELYDWDSSRELYQGNRDFDQDWPNKEPRDFQEVTLDATNKLAAGIVDQQGAMELTGEKSPDDMLERVRADYMDTVLHPEKAQSYILLQRLEQQIAIEAQQAGIQAATAQAQLAQLAGTAPGGAPSGASPEQQAGAASQAQTQAAQQAAPQQAPGQNAPATPGGAPATAGQAGSKYSTLVQDGGAAQNRIINQGQF